MSEAVAGDQFFQEIDKMPEGGALVIRIDQTDPDQGRYQVAHTPLKSFAVLYGQPDQPTAAGVASLAIRPGAALFWATLEHTWFAPLGVDEALYVCAWARWCGEIWTLGFIPHTLAWTFEEAARLTGMRVAQGCPGIIDHEGFHRFPLPWVRNLENDSDVSMNQVSEDALRFRLEGSISAQEFIRRISHAERAMMRDESEAIRRIYRDHGIKTDP